MAADTGAEFLTENTYIPAQRGRSKDAVWVTVRANTLEELSARIDALCDALTAESPTEK